MPFPPVGSTVPSLSAWQIGWAGQVWGPNTPFEFVKIEGLDQPTVRTGDAGRARDAGSFIGLDLLSDREITITGDLLTTSATTWANFAGSTVPGGTTETPFYINLPPFGTLACMARVRRRSMPLDIQAALGNLINVTLQFAASDPRLYATPTQSVSVTPPGTTAGFAFPMAFPLSFGGGAIAGSLLVTNAGDIETRPLLTVTGPCTNPSITNISLAGTPNLTFNVTMAAGDQLVIDTDFHTATYYVSGSSVGSMRLYTLARGSTWFTLPPGTSTLQFITSDPTATGTLTCTYASAYIL